MTRMEIFAYIKETYGVMPDYPWESDQESAVFRHPKSRKWFTLMMRIPLRHLGIDCDESADVMNLKCDPDMITDLRREPYIFPAYHMNKEHWITIYLDQVVDEALVCSLINLSFSLTQKP